jgi:hypothetical protein
LLIQTSALCIFFAICGFGVGRLRRHAVWRKKRLTARRRAQKDRPAILVTREQAIEFYTQLEDRIDESKRQVMKHFAALLLGGLAAVAALLGSNKGDPYIQHIAVGCFSLGLLISMAANSHSSQLNFSAGRLFRAFQNDPHGEKFGIELRKPTTGLSTFFMSIALYTCFWIGVTMTMLSFVPEACTRPSSKWGVMQTCSIVHYLKKADEEG